jgi:uncharacterized RDD family membrane protein YckC
MRWVPVAADAYSAGVREAPYAGFWIRLAGWFVDWLLSRLLAIVIGIVIGLAGALLDEVLQSKVASNVGTILSEVLLIAAGWLYFGLMQSSRLQASLGQLAVGVCVTDYEGRRITFLRATGRYFASLLSYLICFVGYLMIAFTDRKQGLHDLIAGTVMVRARAAPGVALLGSRTAPAPAAGAGVALAVVGAAAVIVLLTSIVAIVVLLTMGHQIENVFSNVVVALEGP